MRLKGTPLLPYPAMREPFVGTKQDCWFCLATEHVAAHLIVSVGNETYLSLAKGSLNEEHVLILPIVHVSSSFDLTSEQAIEMDQYKTALKSYYQSKGQAVCIEEKKRNDNNMERINQLIQYVCVCSIFSMSVIFILVPRNICIFKSFLLLLLNVLKLNKLLIKKLREWAWNLKN